MKNIDKESRQIPIELRTINKAQLKETLQREYAGGFDAIEEQWLLDYTLEHLGEISETAPVTVEELTNEVFVILDETPYWAQAADRLWRIIKRSLMPI